MKPGNHYRFRKLEFWADTGLINIIDERFEPDDDRSHLVITVRQFLLNVKGMNDAINFVPSKYADEREEMHRFVGNAVACCKEAKNQGRPDDPRAMADILKARRRHYSMGVGQSTILHTTAAEGTPEGALLPPIPGHSSKIIISGGL
jgi:hypothetical protein